MPSPRRKRRTPTSGLAAVLLALAVLAPVAWAVCVLPGNLETQGSDCLQFDGVSDTTVKMKFDDGNLVASAAGYIQLGARSTPGFNYELTDLQYGTSTNLANFDAGEGTLLTGLFAGAAGSAMDYNYTYIQERAVVKPSYISFVIKAGVYPLGVAIQMRFLSNNNGFKNSPNYNAPDGVLQDQTTNLYVSIVRTITGLPPTRSPTSLPSALPTRVPSQSPSSLPTTLPSLLPSKLPSTEPTLSPSLAPTTASPSASPTLFPSKIPTVRCHTHGWVTWRCAVSFLHPHVPFPCLAGHAIASSFPCTHHGLSKLVSNYRRSLARA